MNRVLLVEDEPWLGELYVGLMEKSKLEVIWCRDGYDAIGILDKDRPDLVVLDIMLPWANGLQLLNEMASFSDLLAIPVIIYSGAIPRGMTKASVEQYGVVALLDKATAGPSQLMDAIKEALGEKYSV